MTNFCALCEVVHSISSQTLRSYIVEYASVHYSTMMSKKIAEYFFMCFKLSCEDNRLDFGSVMARISCDYDNTKPITRPASDDSRTDIHRFVPMSVFEDMISAMQVDVHNADYVMVS